MLIVELDIVELPRETEIEARVVQGGKDTTNEDEDDESDHVGGGDDEESKEMVVLACGKLEGVDVDGVHVASRWSLLLMVVFVDESVDGPMMQSHVKETIEKIIYDVE